MPGPEKKRPHFEKKNQNINPGQILGKVPKFNEICISH